jgi:hypothetical protein
MYIQMQRSISDGKHQFTGAHHYNTSQLCLAIKIRRNLAQTLPDLSMNSKAERNHNAKSATSWSEREKEEGSTDAEYGS